MCFQKFLDKILDEIISSKTSINQPEFQKQLHWAFASIEFRIKANILKLTANNYLQNNFENIEIEKKKNNEICKYFSYEKRRLYAKIKIVVHMGTTKLNFASLVQRANCY